MVSHQVLNLTLEQKMEFDKNKPDSVCGQSTQPNRMQELREMSTYEAAVAEDQALMNIQAPEDCNLIPLTEFLSPHFETTPESGTFGAPHANANLHQFEIGTPDINPSNEYSNPYWGLNSMIQWWGEENCLPFDGIHDYITGPDPNVPEYVGEFNLMQFWATLEPKVTNPWITAKDVNLTTKKTDNEVDEVLEQHLQEIVKWNQEIGKDKKESIKPSKIIGL